jgi:hypothetical protein
MVDYFALAISHGLLAIAVWRLLARADLDEDHPQPRPAPRKGVGVHGESGGDA